MNLRRWLKSFRARRHRRWLKASRVLYVGQAPKVDERSSIEQHRRLLTR